MTTATATLDKKFRQVYADAIMTDAQWTEAVKIRELSWRGKRMSLAKAAKLYAALVNGYNAFQPNMLLDLLAAFPNAGIEVTPARESSVAVYLHIPSDLQVQVRQFVVGYFKADEVDLQDDESLRVWWD